MKVLILIGLLNMTACSLLSQKKPSEVENYIQKLKNMREDTHASNERWIVIPVPKPRS